MGAQRVDTGPNERRAGRLAATIGAAVTAIATATFVASVVAAFGLVLVAFASAAAAQVDDDRLITADGAGDAVVGSTPAEMQAQLGPDFQLVDIGPFLVDIEGVEVQKDGTPQFFAGYVAGEGPDLDLLVITNSEYQTAEGVGPGTPIVDAEGIYGDATLSFNVNSESREFVRFENGPEGRILFRVDNSDGMVGIYDDPDAEFAETTEYGEYGVIESIWVSCTTDCPATELAYTGAGDTTALLALAGVALILAGLIVRRFSVAPTATAL